MLFSTDILTLFLVGDDAVVAVVLFYQDLQTDLAEGEAEC